MIQSLTRNTFARVGLTMLVAFCLLTLTSHAALAQAPAKTYEVELVVSEGKKSLETDAVLSFKENSFSVVPDKSTFASSTKGSR